MTRFFNIKRISASIFALAMCVNAFAYDIKDSNNIFYNITSESALTAEVTYETSNFASYTSQNVTVPSTVEHNGKTYSVTAIGKHAFRASVNVTTITLPASVNTLNSYCFYGCSALESVNLPNGIKAIPDEAFFNCTKLNNLTVPNSVTEIGYGAFYNTQSLLESTMSNALTIIDDWAFAYSAIFDVALANGASKLGESAFFCCENLLEFHVPGSVGSIAQSTFYGCSNMETLTLGNGITSIGKNAFCNTFNIKEVAIPGSVTLIHEQAFSYCGAQTLNFLHSTSPITIYGSSDDVYQSGSFAHVNCNKLIIDRDITIHTESLGDLMLRDAKLTDLTYGDNIESLSLTLSDGSSVDLTSNIGTNLLTSLTCGKKLTSVPALTNSQLTSVYVRNPEPPTAGGFNATTYLYGTLYLSDFEEAKRNEIADLYAAANVWKRFRKKNFYSGIDGIIADFDSNELVDVYDLHGHCVRHGVNIENATNDLPQGIYIVGGKKIIVR